MSTSEKPDLARAWLRAEKIMDEEADRLAAMSDEEFEREMAKQPAPSRVPSAEELLARGAARAKMRREAALPHASGAGVELRRAQPTKRQWTVWLLAAAFAVVAVFVAARRREIVAWIVRENIRPDNQWVESSPERRAAALREKAFASCRQEMWTQCEDTLNEAKKLDPAADANPRVQEAHKEALDGMSHDLRKLAPDRKQLPPDTK